MRLLTAGLLWGNSFFTTAVKGLVLGFLLLYVAFIHVLHAFERQPPKLQRENHKGGAVKKYIKESRDYN